MQAAATFSKLFKLAKARNPQMLFNVSRGDDDKMIVYSATRLGDTLVGDGVTVHVEYAASPERREEVSEVLKQHVFGFAPVKKISHGVYATALKLLPERQITLRLKKSGAVTASARVAGSAEAVIFNVAQELEWSALGVPDLKSLTLYGVDAKTKKVVVEKIVVTQDMKARVDTTAIMAAYMQGNV